MEHASIHGVYLVDMGNAEDTEKLHVKHIGIGFFHRFACCAKHAALTILHETGRQRPGTIPGFDRAPAQQDPVTPFRYATGNNIGILVVNGATGITHIAVPVITCRHEQIYFGTTRRTEIHNILILQHPYILTMFKPRCIFSFVYLHRNWTVSVDITQNSSIYCLQFEW